MVNDTTISKIRFIWKQYEELNENNINIETKGSSEENTLMARRITELRDLYPDYYFRPMSRCSASDFAYYGNDIYNALCENKYPAGCVAIAMAQILKFHQYPIRYNWNNMPNISATYDTQRLIYEIGQAVEMDYGANGSSSNIDNAKKAFQGTFQYNARIADFNVDETKTELLNNKRPIYMRGSDNFLFFPKDGHAWVCDGVDDQYRETIYFVEFQQGYPGNYYYVSPYDGPTAGSPGEMFVGVLFFHMNWGWGDNNGNGWFGSNNVTVNGYDFSHNRKNLYISPNK